MKYVVDVNGARVTVEIDGGSATIDGVRHAVSLHPVDGTPVRLVRIGEATHRVIARRGARRGEWTLDIAGERYEADALDERLRAIRDMTAAAASASGPAPLVAPMPGLIIRVSVSAGDVVAAGQGLVVVEAMKMENELKAPMAAVVVAVRAEPGRTVEKGAILVELGPLPTD